MTQTEHPWDFPPHIHRTVEDRISAHGGHLEASQALVEATKRSQGTDDVKSLIEAFTSIHYGMAYAISMLEGRLELLNEYVRELEQRVSDLESR